MGRGFVLFALLVLSGTCASKCPALASPGTCLLDCSHTPLDRIPTLPGGQLSRLTRMTIINCHLTNFNRTLEGLDKLLELDLSNNSLTDIDHDSLKSLISLTDLTLRGNGISVLNDRFLESCKDLKSLDLSSNSISTLNGSPFESSHLIRLNVSRNRISSLTGKSLRGLENLQLIDLSLNLISVLEDSIFHKFTSLQWLNLSGNFLSTLSEGYFLGLSGLQHLDVSLNCITSVSGSGIVEALSGLLEVRVAGNPLGPRHKELMVLVGSGRRLQTVDVSACNLTEIPGALTWSIRHLKLAHNQLIALRRGDLDSYPLLHELDVSNNLISEVEDDALGRLELLSFLKLSGNRLSVVPNSLPAGLRVLRLDFNNIQYLNTGDLSGLSHLRELTLQHTSLMAIQDGAFSNVPDLKVLDLSDNPLERLSASVLAGPQSLTTLRLSNLTLVTPDVARDMSFPLASPERLQLLELEGSPVIARQLLADPAALAAFRDLQTLNLRHNDLTYLRSDLFHYMPRLEQLHLAGNQWVCDDMLWLAQWMQQHTREMFDDVRCKSPPRLSERLIVELKVEDFPSQVVSSFPPLTSQVNIHGNNSNRNDSSNTNTDIKGKAALQNQPFSKSKESDSKLNRTDLPAASRQDSFVELVKVNNSLENKTHYELLSSAQVADKEKLLSVRQISKELNGRPALRSGLNNSVSIANANETMDISNDQTDHKHHGNENSNFSVVDSILESSMDRNTNNDTFEELLDITTTEPLTKSSLPDPGHHSQSLQETESSALLNQTSNNGVSNNRSPISSSQNTGPALRSAGKKGSRSAIKNKTTINEILPINKSRGGKVFDKMMRDLFTNNPLRTNENFSRVKSSSSAGFRGEEVVARNQARQIPHIQPTSRLAGAPSSPSARFTSTSQPIQMSTPAPTIQGAPSFKSVSPIDSFDQNENETEIFAVTRTHLDPKEYDDDNNTVVWGTIKSISDLKSPRPVQDWNNSMLIGIVHTSMTMPVVKHHEATNRLHRASDAFLSRVADTKKKLESSHPGMYVLLGLALIVLVLVLAAVAHFVIKRKRAVEYSRQQDIEVRSMSTVGELW